MTSTPNQPFFHKINQMSFGFIGLGLIGSSIAKALRSTFPDCRIIAFNRSEKPRLLALADKVANIAVDMVNSVFQECDYIFLCTPVEYNEAYLKTLKSVIKSSCIITDVGSVKTNIHKAVIAEGMEENFIGGHPMAGSEKTGYENSSAQLCENAFYAITPTALSSSEKVSEYRAIVESIGAIPIILDYRTHDYSVAAISHLPHIIAAQLVNLVRDYDSGTQIMKQMAAGGFKDITRIASSSPEMWEQICMTNSENIATLLDKYIDYLQSAKKMLIEKNGNGINELFQKSRVYRNSFNDGGIGLIRKEFLIYLDIADETGAIGEIAVKLADAGINIKNIGIVHNREFEGGVLKIIFYDETTYQSAEKLLKAEGYTLYKR